MKRKNLNYFFTIIALVTVGFLSSCNKEEDDVPNPNNSDPQFDTTLSRGGIILFSQYASTGNGSFYSSKTKTVSNSTNADGKTVDISYADIAVSGSALDMPMFISPDYRTESNQTGATGTISNLPNAGTTYFKATTLMLTTATAKEVSDGIADIGTAKSVEITGENSNYLFSNTTTGAKGIIMVRQLQSVATSTEGQTTSNVAFDIKVLK